MLLLQSQASILRLCTFHTDKKSLFGFFVFSLGWNTRMFVLMLLPRSKAQILRFSRFRQGRFALVLSFTASKTKNLRIFCFSHLRSEEKRIFLRFRFHRNGNYSVFCFFLTHTGENRSFSLFPQVVLSRRFVFHVMPLLKLLWYLLHTFSRTKR